MEKNFWTKNYSKCLKFFKESKKFILTAIILFLVTAIIGFIFPVFFRDEILLAFKEMVNLFDGKSVFETIVLIFSNNIRVAFFSILLGIGVGIFPFVTCAINGYVVGFASKEAVKESGPIVLLQLLPHGIFELPAVLFSIGIGMKIGFDLFFKDSRKRTKENFIDGFRFFIFVIVPLLIIAALIEGILVCI